MDSFAEMLETIREYLAAEHAYRKCVEGCEYDAGYFCAREYDRMEEARTRAEHAFIQAVRAAVAEVEVQPK